ncbi:S-layer homology domain-containing protein [Aquibacillus sediminis]|uniref:S-layer homology domain-containing protein n=1 Tax=Aquibacillus sediminis TaxID=2574734 RepID=UPI00148736BB|nr:S-layer homology domain-containing protein [Aquibacillus sediminis]
MNFKKYLAIFLSAILVSTYSFAPVFPQQVEAADEDWIGTYVEKIQGYYDNLDPSEQEILREARTFLEDQEAQWWRDNLGLSEFVNHVKEEKGIDGNEAMEFIGAFISVFYGIDETFESNLADFRDTHGDTFKAVFGNDFTLQELVEFMEAVQEEALTGQIIPAMLTDGLTDTTIDEIMTNAINETFETGDYDTFQNRLSDVHLSVEDLLGLNESFSQEEIYDGLDISDVRAVFINAAAREFVEVIDEDTEEVISDLPSIDEGDSKEIYVKVANIGTYNGTITTILDWESEDSNIATVEENTDADTLVINAKSVSADTSADIVGSITIGEDTLNLVTLTLNVNDTSSSSPGSGSGSGGSPSTPGDGSEDSQSSVDIGDEDVEESTTADGKKQTKVNVTKEKIDNIVNSNDEVDEVTIEVPEVADSESASVSLPAEAFNALKGKNENARVTVKSKAGSYSLGAKEINVEALATSLGASSSEDVSVSIEITQSEDTNNAVVNNGAAAASAVVEFKVMASSGDSQEEVNNFSSYVSRSIPLNASADGEEQDTNNLTAVRINEEGTLTAVPTVFANGEAVFRSVTNSKYTVVENNKSFTDVSDNYWASDVITRLANKLVVQGTLDGTYEPNADIKRSEFVALLTRSLGLTTTNAEYDDRFSDVDADAWFVNELVAAVDAGIVEGKPNGTFDPHSTVKRHEAAAMVARAMAFASYNAEKLDDAQSIDQFTDSKVIAGWSTDAIQLTVQADIFNGKEFDNGDRYFDATAGTTRAEAAEMLNNFLSFIEFMN